MPNPLEGLKSVQPRRAGGMFIAVRHGITAFNDNGGKGATPAEKFRGWLPIPQTREGMAASQKLAESLTRFKDVNALYTSDVVRAVQSAQDIANVLDIEMEPVIELRDWDLGIYVGQEVEQVLPDVQKHIDEPSRVVKDGESYATFLGRCVPFLKEHVESGRVCIAVTHARVIGLLLALSKTKGGKPDQAILKAKSPVGPSGLLIVKPDWSVSYQSPK